MSSWLYCAVLSIVLLNFALESRARIFMDRTQLDAFAKKDLADPDVAETMDRVDEFSAPTTLAPPLGRRETHTTVNRPADTLVSKRSLLNERTSGRYCGELTGENLKAEVRAVSEEWLQVRNLYWHESLNSLGALRFKTTYKNHEGTFDAIVRLEHNMKLRSQHFEYYVRFARRLGKSMERLEVFNHDNQVLLATLDVSTCVPPRTVLLGRLTGTSGGVFSGDVTLLSANSIMIENLVLPRDNQELVFWAGIGRVDERKGYIIPIDGSKGPIRSYLNPMVARLPRGHTFYDVDYFALVVPYSKESLGHVYLNNLSKEHDLLPPSWLDKVLKSKLS